MDIILRAERPTIADEYAFHFGSRRAYSVTASAIHLTFGVQSAGAGAQCGMSESTQAERESRWRGIIGRQRAGRMGVAEFCRREGIALSTFHWWRRRLGIGVPGAVQWIEARGAEVHLAAAAAARPPAAVRMGTGAGLWVEFAEAPPADLLAAALQALHSTVQPSC
jgi:hypothetical protein